MTTTAGQESAGPQNPEPRLSTLLADMRRTRAFDIGFPGAADVTFPELGDLLTGQLLNNIGDPGDSGHGRNHTKDLEQEVINIVADLLRAPSSRWGYVTTGSSEGTLHALWQARRELGEPRVFTSAQAHYSVAKAADLLRMPLTYVPAHEDGRMDTGALRILLRRFRRQPAVIVATCGTTMSEAVDDVAAIVAACDAAKIARRVHVDAALSGIPLALLPDDERPPFGFIAGADSMVISGHKFLSALEPCGVVVYAKTPAAVVERVAYTGSVDSTIGGSRSGHTVLRLHTCLTRLGSDGHRRRAEAARATAAYTSKRLREIGWPHSRNPHAFTIVLDLPPQPVLDRWVLAHDAHQAHIVTMPGITTAQIDAFIRDLELAAAMPAGASVAVPRQRRPAFRMQVRA